MGWWRSVVALSARLQVSGRGDCAAATATVTMAEGDKLADSANNTTHTVRLSTDDTPSQQS